MTHITIERAKLEQVLEALLPHKSTVLRWYTPADVAITAIKEALAQPERLAELGWQEIDCPICGGGARAFPKPEQEPMACAVCNEVHAILDADESKIIRDAKDGYPDGRTPRILTLQERVTALCVYASDWKRWCLEKENTTPPQRKPLTDEQIVAINDKHYNIAYRDFDADIAIARAIEAAHDIKE